jgi:hypothetical protein
MTTVMIVLVFCVAVGAAARSTWSPCGLSMLSTITPMAEHGRGHRYRATVGWFVTGALLGGASLGAACAALAALYRSAAAPESFTAAVVAAFAMVCAASDSLLVALELPIHRRQVNEGWLDEYRPWVYGVGFGWQIGCGLATYVKTSAVYLLAVLGMLCASPKAAFAAGVLFGFLRGTSVLLARDVKSPTALRSLHRRLSSLDGVGRRTTVAVAMLTSIAAVAPLSLTASLALAVVAVLVGAAGAAAATRARRSAAPYEVKRDSSTRIGVGSGWRSASAMPSEGLQETTRAPRGPAVSSSA